MGKSHELFLCVPEAFECDKKTLADKVEATRKGVAEKSTVD